MNLGIIGALIAMAALTAYAFIVLRTAASDTGGKIRDKVIRQLESYDVLMQKKSYELVMLLKQIDEAKAALPKRSGLRRDDGQELSGFILPDDADMRNPQFFADYKRIRETLIYDRSDVIREILYSRENTDPSNAARKRNLLLDSIMGKFSFDNVYRLSVLHPDEQLEVTVEILSADERELLDEYMERSGRFDSLGFYQWLYMHKKICDDTILVRSADIQNYYSSPDKSIRMVYDRNICEGFQIIVGNRLYDYGIREYELS